MLPAPSRRRTAHPLMPTSRFMLSPPRIDGNALFSRACFFRSSRVQEPASTASIPKPEKCATAANAGKCRFREKPGRSGTDEPGVRNERRSDPERRSFEKNGEATGAALRHTLCGIRMISTAFGCIRKHHARTGRTLTTPRPDSPAGHRPFAQSLTRSPDIPRINLGLRLEPMRDGKIPDAFQIGPGLPVTACSHPSRSGGFLVCDERV